MPSASRLLSFASDNETASYAILEMAHKNLKTARRLKRKLTKKQIIPDAFKGAVWGRLSRLDPDAISVIGELRERSFATALLSNDTKPLGDRVLRFNGIAEMFDRVEFAPNRFTMKPDPSGLIAILSGLDADDGATFMVGDRESDMMTAFRAAKLTGKRVIPVACGPDNSAARYLRSLPLSQDNAAILEGGLSQLPDLICDIRG